MIIVIHVCSKDVDAALRNLAWVKELDGKVPFDCLISHEIGFAANQVMASASEYFRSVSEFGYSVMSRRHEPWPAFQNWAWRKTALGVLRLPNHEPWLWWEQDAVPLRAGWLDTLDAAYTASVKLFLGTIGAAPSAMHPEHLNGVAVYPHDVTANGPESLFYSGEAFDVAGGWRVLQKSEISSLFQHVWSREGNQSPNACTFPDAASMKLVSTDAVLFHRCKDGTLIDRIREGLLDHNIAIAKRRLVPKRRMRRRKDFSIKTEQRRYGGHHQLSAAGDALGCFRVLPESQGPKHHHFIFWRYSRR
jgi:hypothetical protein